MAVVFGLVKVMVSRFVPSTWNPLLANVLVTVGAGRFATRIAVLLTGPTIVFTDDRAPLVVLLKLPVAETLTVTSIVQVKAAAVIAPPVSLIPVEPIASGLPIRSVMVPPQLLITVVLANDIGAGLVGKMSLNETPVMFKPELFTTVIRITLVAVPAVRVTGLVRNDLVRVGLVVMSSESLLTIPIPWLEPTFPVVLVYKADVVLLANTSAPMLQLAPGDSVPPEREIPFSVAVTVPPQVFDAFGVGDVIAAASVPPPGSCADVG